MIPCNKCGLCCIIELCSKGIRKDKKKKWNCKYLVKNDDGTTSCQSKEFDKGTVTYLLKQDFEEVDGIAI